MGAFAELQTQWSDRFRSTLGVRLDHYGYIEVYANWGRGFHSNDVHGATITADLNASFVDSEFVDVASSEDHIPNAHGRVIGAGWGGATQSVRC